MQTLSCRFCTNSVAVKHSVAIFSIDSVKSGMLGRLSIVSSLPVAAGDGLSQYMCRSCNRKFIVAECFRSTVRTCYEKRGFQVSAAVSVESSPKCFLAEKGPKDTSGTDVSPHTSRVWPLAKRSTTTVPGKRLPFSSHENCKLNQVLTIYLILGLF